MKHIVWGTLSIIALLMSFRLIAPAAPTSDYHIAYFLDRSTTYENDHVRPENLFKGMTDVKVDVVYTWKDLLKVQAAQPLDALVMHESAVSVRIPAFPWPGPGRLRTVVST